ncbi:hypothetical protein E1171_06130, partial [Cytophagales bacterium RKSG123]|nr:hypothetical protein [Xanthovirga aplysinae]
MTRRTSIFILFFTTLMAVICAIQSLNLTFDYDFEQFFPHNDPDTEFFHQYRNQFGSDNDFILLGITNKEGIFEVDFLEKLFSLTTKIENLPHVLSVQSPTNLKEYRMDPIFGGVFEIPFLQLNRKEKLQQDSIR